MSLPRMCDNVHLIDPRHPGYGLWKMICGWVQEPTFSDGSSRQPRSDQTLPLLQTDDADLGQLLHVLVQLLPEVVYRDKRACEVKTTQSLNK